MTVFYYKFSCKSYSLKYDEASKEVGEANLKKDMQKITQAQAKLTMSLDAKRQWAGELEELYAKKHLKK